jgi:maleate isomerase/arylmalonate decarboxylase
LERDVQGRHRSAYGYRARIGLIVPPTNTVNEAEWARTIPDGVTFHTVRMPLHPDTTTDEGRQALVDDITARVRELSEARVDVVAYACTAGSMINPRHALADEVEAATGVPLVTTAAAIVDALARLGAKRVSIATPYHDALNRHEMAYLAGNGIETLAIRGLGLGANGPSDWPLIAETPVAAVEEHARSALADGSDALLITCTDFPTLPFAARLECELGLPVVTSNQATLWAALRRAGIHDHIPSLGRLLQRS